MAVASSPSDFVFRPDGVQIAYRYLPSSSNPILDDNAAPMIVFLPGYMSDMQGGKALALAAWAQDNGRAMLRLDYSGCGESGGDFSSGTLTRWRDDVVAVLDVLPKRPLILVGSSMGGWLMLMVACFLGERVAAMVGIAAAPDFTSWGYSDAQKAAIIRDGVLYEDNPYGPEPAPTYRGFYEDGEAHLMLPAPIAIGCPVRLLHGQDDRDVPWNISVRLAAALRSSDVQLHLIKDGDHRLSREGDLALLIATVARLFV